MVKGTESTIVMVFVIFVVVSSLLFLTVFLRSLDPLQSPELEALRLSNQISIYLNALSTVEKGNITIQIDHPVDIHIRHVGTLTEQGWQRFLNEIQQFEISEGYEKSFSQIGHYVFVTPYRNETQKPFESSFIIGYPKAKQEDLEKTFKKPTSLCFSKEQGKFRAEVNPC